MDTSHRKYAANTAVIVCIVCKINAQQTPIVRADACSVAGRDVQPRAPQRNDKLLNSCRISLRVQRIRRANARHTTDIS
ncbi:hypothetical protein TNCV_1679171 [Trichonephila clavipes]|nr:hypothetical protein TNCV_1679171 [Trichonephila clavipes]